MSSRRRRSRRVQWVYVIAGAAAVTGTFVPVHPSGVVVADHLLAGAAVGLVSLAASRARRWTWLVLAGITATFAAVPWSAVAAWFALAVGAVSASRRQGRPEAGAVVGALGALASLRLVDGGHTGLSAVLALSAAAPVLVSGYQHAGRATRRRARRSLWFAAAAVTAVLLAYGTALTAARRSSAAGAAALGEAISASRRGDVAAASGHLDRATTALHRASGQAGGWWVRPAWALPVVGHNAAAIADVLDAAHDLSSTASDVLHQAEQEELALRGGRVDPGAFERLRPSVGELVVAIDNATGVVDTLDSPWLAAAVVERIRELGSELDRARDDADVARQAVDALPGLLGQGGERRYLVLFVTPVEARATGFPGNFAELTVTDGRLAMPRFGRMPELAVRPGDADPVLDLPAEFLERYERFGIRREWRSVTTSPHFPLVADLAAQLYAQTGGQPVDGVLTIDPAAIAGLLRFIGPISVPEVTEPLSAENAERFLLLDQYVELPARSGDPADRVDALESLGRTTLDRLVNADLPPPQVLGPTMGPLARAGHLRFVVFDPGSPGAGRLRSGPSNRAEAAFLSRIGIDHPLPVPSADSLAVTNTNVSGGKLDQFLHRTVDYDTTWDPASGVVDARLTVRVRNDSPTSGLPDYVIGEAIRGVALPPGTSRSRISIYSPWSLEEAALNGQPLAMEHTRERGHFVYGTALELAPGGGEATIELHLTGALDPGQSYELSVWNQVLVNADNLSVTVAAAGDSALRVAGMDLAGRTASIHTVLVEPVTYGLHLSGAE